MTSPNAPGSEGQTPREILASRLIDAWCADKGKQIPWAKAVQITAIVTRQSDTERDRLLHMGDDDGSCEMCGRNAIALERELAALRRQPVGEIVVSCDENGQCVSITRQDDEGQILSVVWELEVKHPPARTEGLPEADVFVLCLPESKEEEDFVRREDYDALHARCVELQAELATERADRITQQNIAYVNKCEALRAEARCEELAGELADAVKSPVAGVPLRAAFEMAVENVRLMKLRAESAEAQLAAQSRWVPVGERLPELPDNEPILCASIYGVRYTISALSLREQLKFGGVSCPWTHWRELPPLPGE